MHGSTPVTWVLGWHRQKTSLIGKLRLSNLSLKDPSWARSIRRASIPEKRKEEIPVRKAFLWPSLLMVECSQDMWPWLIEMRRFGRSPVNEVKEKSPLPLVERLRTSPAAVSSFPWAEGMKELGVAALGALAFAIGSWVGACLKERTQSLGYLSTYRDLASAAA